MENSDNQNSALKLQKQEVTRKVRRLILDNPALIDKAGKISYLILKQKFCERYYDPIMTDSINRAARKVREELKIKGRDLEGEEINREVFRHDVMQEM